MKNIQMRHKGEDMGDFNSVLTLQEMVFDKIQFERKGFKNSNEVEFELQVQIGVSDEGIYKVTLVLNSVKKDEYDIIISLTGIFSVDQKIEDKTRDILINKNAVAILMPYLRSELSLLTAQPNTECIVLPPFNINKMLEKST